MVWHLNYVGYKMYYEKIVSGYPVCSDDRNDVCIILKDKFLSIDADKYPFLLDKIINAKKMFEVAQWCDENLKDDYLVGKDASGFENGYDAMAFKLRWV